MSRVHSSTLIACIGALLALGLLVSGCEEYREKLRGRVTFVIPNDTSNPEADLNAITVTGPLAGILIEAKSLKDGTKVQTYSDCDGYYELEGIRFGPNNLRTYIWASKDLLGPDGNVVCKATAVTDYFDTRPYFIDMHKDKDQVLDIVLTRLGKFERSGLSVAVRDEAGAPITSARVDLYRGRGTTYSYVATRSECPDGNYTFFVPPTPTPTPTPGGEETPTPTPEPAPNFPHDLTRSGSLQFTPEPAPADLGCSPENPFLLVEEFSVEQWRAEVSAPGYANTTSVWELGYFDVLGGPWRQTVYLSQDLNVTVTP